MLKDIQSIFESITPDNISNLPVIKDAMGIFIETLEDLSKESIDIKNIYDNELIREEMVKIYLDDLYTVLQNIKKNQKIVEKINKINNIYDSENTGNEYFNSDAIFNLTKYINDEHFLAFKSFKQNKGTKEAIQYIYDLIGIFVNTGDTEQPFRLDELAPFQYKVSGSLPSEFFEYIIRPLAHPMGFTYIYEQGIILGLEDFFPDFVLTYTIYDLEVRCLQSDGSVMTTDYRYYYDEEGNHLTDEFGTYLERTVTSVSTVFEGTDRTKRIYFSDGNYLKQTTTSAGQTHVHFMNSSDVSITEYNEQCSIYFSYDFISETTITEDFHTTFYKDSGDWFSRLNEFSYYYSGIIGAVDGGKDVLNDQIGEGFIGDGLDTPDKGWNDFRDVNGNFLVQGASGFPEGRMENYFAPEAFADLKLLGGEYEKNVDIYDGGRVVDNQVIFYTNTVNPEYRVVERVNTETNYNAQNIGNEEYLGKEHYFYNNITLLSGNETMIDPIYNSNYLNLIGTYDEDIGVDELTIGSFDDRQVARSLIHGEQFIYLDYINTENGRTVGDDWDIGSYYYPEDYDGLVNPNLTIGLMTTLVDAEPVNLQYNTFSILNVNIDFSDTDDNSENVSDALIFDYTKSQFDDYGFHAPYTELGVSAEDIGEPTGWINAEPWYLVPGQTTTAAKDLQDGSPDLSTYIWESSGTSLYEYQTFVNVLGTDTINNITGFIGEGYITGITRSEIVTAEVYRGSWNNVQGEDASREFDDMYINNFSEFSEEMVTEESELGLCFATSTSEIWGVYQPTEHYIGEETFLIGNFWITGTPFNTDESGKPVAVLDDDFEFGVYRYGVLLTDNNYAAWVA